MMKIFILILFIILSNNLSLSQELQSFGLQDKVITSLAVEQADYNNFSQPSDFIFAGTKEDGVYKASATDESPDWTHLGLTGKPIAALTIEHWGVGPMDGLRLFAAVQPDYEKGDSTLIFSKEVRLSMDTNWVISGTNLGVYTMTGNLWTQSEIENENLQPAILSIDVNPHWVFLQDPIAWAAGYTGLSSAAFRSTDRGETWKVFPLSDAQEYVPASSVAINTRSSDSVYISWNREILLTPDNGGNWEPVFSSRGIFINALAIDPLYPENVFAGGWFFDDSGQSPNHGIFLHSTNGGKDWIEHYTIDSSLLGNITSIAVLNKFDSTYVFV